MRRAASLVAGVGRRTHSLSSADPELFQILEMERERQSNGIELIASENYASANVMAALGSVLTNKYAEGYPGRRYYAGNHVIDMNERLCQERALKLYGLDPQEWSVNVQPYSGSPANFAVYTALLRPHDRVMGLDLPHGGHLTHGYMTLKKRISATSVFFESMPYYIDQETGLIDYDGLERAAHDFKPRLIIAGFSAYARDLDYPRFRAIADSVGAYVLADMSHVSGLVAAGLAPSPFEGTCDVVTTTTHKTLRGPRSGMIFSRRTNEDDLPTRIDNAVFPMLQGGPHQHQIAAVSAALLEATQPEFVAYQEQVLANCRAMAQRLREHGYHLVSGGSSNHLMLVRLLPLIDGARAEKVLELAGVTINKNAVPGDTKPMVPGGIRIGTPAMTTRGMKEDGARACADFLHRGIQIAATINAEHHSHSQRISNFVLALQHQERREILELREEVEEFARKFPLPASHAGGVAI